MNRQTMAVAIGTLAVLLIAVILLYFTPSPEPNPSAGDGLAVAGKAGKADDGRVQPRRLIHRRDIPEDRPAAPQGSPNVVVVFASTQRRDQWTVYGGPSESTPFLASQVADHGVKLMDALAVAVSPHEAAAALTTGRYPHHVGAIEPGERRNGRPISDDAVTLAERLADAGWFTVGVSANHHLNKRMNQIQGFDWYRDSQPYSLMQDRRIPAGQAVRFALRRVADRTDAEKERPLYLQLALIDSHKPFKVPPAEFKRFEGPEHSPAPYLATIRRMDDALQTLLLGLSQEGVDVSNTLFVVVADHGEGLDMPPHHRKQHGYVLYGSVVRIPWVMWGRGLPKGRDVLGLASQIDLVPTVISLAGLPSGAPCDGIDLSGAVLGKAKRTPRTEAYADTLFRGVHRASLWTATRECQKDFGTQIEIADDGFVDGCFDRVEDPDFVHPIVDDALMARLVAQHDDLMGPVARSAVAAGASVED